MEKFQIYVNHSHGRNVSHLKRHRKNDDEEELGARNMQKRNTKW
jgi:hypothetical protein